MIFYYDYTIL